MDHRIVHEDYQAFGIRLRVQPDVLQDSVHEAFKESCVEGPLYDLRADNLFLAYCGYVRHGVLLPFDSLLADGELKTLIAVLTQLLSQKLLILFSQRHLRIQPYRESY